MTVSFGPANRMKLHPVTYWAPGELGADNEVAYAPPVLIWGRWTEETATLQGAAGEQITSKTQVIVDRDVEEGGYLAKGSHMGALSPNEADAHEIQGFTSTPDLRYMEQIRRAYL